MKTDSMSMLSLVVVALVGAVALAGCIHPKLEPAPPTGAEKRAEERAAAAQKKALEVGVQVAETTAETIEEEQVATK